MSITSPLLYLQDTFASNGSVIDQSSQPRTITVSGVKETHDVDFGSCFEFSGADGFEVAGFSCPASFTVALWLKRSAMQEGRWHALMAFGDNQPLCGLRDLKPSISTTTAPERLSLAAWHHLAMTFDAETQMCLLYVDGKCVATGVGLTNTSGTVLQIGYSANTSSVGFMGKLAHVLVYDRVLSEDDVQQLMAITQKTFKPYLLLRDTTRLVENIVSDDSGQGFDCTAANMTAGDDDVMGPCFLFGATSYIERYGYQCTDAFTISAWVWRSSSSTNFCPLIQFAPNSPQFGMEANMLKLFGGAAASITVPSETWQHVAVTYNPVSAKSELYVDGISVASATDPIETSGTGLLVGKSRSADDGKFTGRMAHIAVHDTPLSHEDIQVMRHCSMLRPVLHLPLEIMETNGRTPNIADQAHNAICSGCGAVPDIKFGTALAFDGVDDIIEISNATCPESFTFAVYVNPDMAISGRNVPLLKFGDGDHPEFGLYSGKPGLYQGAMADDVLERNRWHHVAATFDASTNLVTLFINGNPVASGTFTGQRGGTGLAIGHSVGTGWFKGRMRHVMIYDRPLSQIEIGQSIIDTEPPAIGATSTRARPVAGLLTMDLVNDDDEPVLYINHNVSQQLSISIENTSGGDIRLASTTLPAGPDCFHFQLQFRQGVLHPTFRDALAAGSSSAINRLDTIGWDLHFADLGPGGDQISLLWRGEVIAAWSGAPPYLLDGVIKAKTRALIPLQGVQIKAGAGSRTTRVLMLHDKLLLPDGTAVPSGQRIELLNVLYRSQASAEFSSGAAALDDARAAFMQAKVSVAAAGAGTNDQGTLGGRLPVDMKLKGATSILNDGGTNTITLEIKNSHYVNGNPAAIGFGMGTTADKTPAFYLSADALFDTKDGSSIDNATNVEVIIRSSITTTPRDWTCERINNSPPQWRLKPPSNNTFEAGEALTVTIQELKTTEYNGTAYLRVRYEDIAEYGEGDFYVPIRVAPLSFTRCEGRDTVVVRHGDHHGNASAAPGNEALYVETAEGNAARFYGGTGVTIENVNTDAHALHVKKDQTNSTYPAIRVDKKGDGHALYAVVDSVSAGIYVDQNGSGNAAWFDGGAGVKIDNVDKDSYALYVNKDKMDSTGSAVRVDKKGTGYALHADVNTSADPAIYVDQAGDGGGAQVRGGGVFINEPKKSEIGLMVKTTAISTAVGMRVEQYGTGNAAEFIGGSGVTIDEVKTAPYALHVRTTTDSDIHGIYVDQQGSGKAAAFLGGIGVSVSGVKATANSLDINATSDSDHAGIFVQQNGAGYAAEFKGGKGVHVTKDLQVDGALKAGTGGLTVPAGAPVRGIPILDFKSLYLDTGPYYKNGEGVTLQGTLTFAHNVVKAEAFLKGYDVMFQGEHPLHKIFIWCSCTHSGREVTVSVVAGLCDNTGTYDDNYSVCTTVTVIATLENAI